MHVYVPGPVPADCCSSVRDEKAASKSAVKLPTTENRSPLGDAAFLPNYHYEKASPKGAEAYMLNVPGIIDQDAGHSLQSLAVRL